MVKPKTLERGQRKECEPVPQKARKPVAKRVRKPPAKGAQDQWAEGNLKLSLKEVQKPSVNEHRKSSIKEHQKPAPEEGQKQFTAKNRKRARDSSLEITDVRPISKKRTIKYDSIAIPLNDPVRYRQAVDRADIYPVPPNSHVHIDFATRNNLLNRVVYGIRYTDVIEYVVVDEETLTPWQVPKVTQEFRRINYKSEYQPYTAHCRQIEGQELSPTSLPQMRDMTTAEHKQAEDDRDPNLDVIDECLFEVIGTSTTVIQQGIITPAESPRQEAPTVGVKCKSAGRYDNNDQCKMFGSCAF